MTGRRREEAIGRAFAASRSEIRFVRGEPEDGGSGLPVEYASLRFAGSDPDEPPLVLLHGSNGGEGDLLDLAGGISAGSELLAVRGDVEMHPGFAFFRRAPDRRVDVGDLRLRAARLVRFLRDVGERNGWRKRPIVIGYSNGAVMATAILLSAPDMVGGAILLRPLLPFAPSSDTRLSALPVLVVDGLDDERRAPSDGRSVRDALRGCGAVVAHETSRSGHRVGPDDERIARMWIRSVPAAPAVGSPGSRS